MADNINIRFARKEDKEAILNICSQIWEGDDYIPNVIDEWLKNENSKFFILEYNGVITHFERLRIQSQTDGWAEGLRADPQYSGKGLASKLMSYIVEYAKKIGLKTLRASIYYKNDASLALTQKMGYDLIKKYIFARKEIENIPEKSTPTNVISLTEKHFFPILKFLEESQTYKEFDRFITNGWLFHKHKDSIWYDLLKNGKIYTTSQSEKLESLMLLDYANCRFNELSIGFIDGNTEAINTLINYAEQTVKRGGYDELCIVAPENTKLANHIRTKEFETWEESYDANVLLFEKKL